MSKKIFWSLFFLCLPSFVFSGPPYGVKDQADSELGAFEPKSPAVRQALHYVLENSKMNERDISILITAAQPLADQYIDQARVLGELEKERCLALGQVASKLDAKLLPHLGLQMYPTWLVEKDGIIDQAYNVLDAMKRKAFDWKTGGILSADSAAPTLDLPHDHRITAVKVALFLLRAAQLEEEPRKRGELTALFNQLTVAKRIPVPTDLFSTATLDHLQDSIFFSAASSCFYALHAGFIWGGPGKTDYPLYAGFVQGTITADHLSNPKILRSHGVGFGLRDGELLNEYAPEKFLYRGFDASGFVSLFGYMQRRESLADFSVATRAHALSKDLKIDPKDILEAFAGLQKSDSAEAPSSARATFDKWFPDKSEQARLPDLLSSRSWADLRDLFTLHPFAEAQEGDVVYYSCPDFPGLNVAALFLRWTDSSNPTQGFIGLNVGRRSQAPIPPYLTTYEGPRVFKFPAPASTITPFIARVKPIQ